jgi:hypothetical protein
MKKILLALMVALFGLTFTVSADDPIILDLQQKITVLETENEELREEIMAIYRMTSDEQTKLTGVEEGAEVNVIEGVKVSDGASVLTPSAKVVTIPAANATNTDGVMSWEDKAKVDKLPVFQTGSASPDAGSYAYDDYNNGIPLVAGKRYHVEFSARVYSITENNGFKIRLKLDGSNITGAGVSGIMFRPNESEYLVLYTMTGTGPSYSDAKEFGGISPDMTTVGAFVKIDAIIWCTAGTDLNLIIEIGAETTGGASATANNSVLYVTEIDSVH